MKASQLTEMIRKIVAEEVRKQLPGIMSEMYVRKIVNESMGKKKASNATLGRYGLAEEITDDEVPEPMDNSDEGVYQSGPVGRKNESVRNILLNPENPYASVYQTTISTREREVESSNVPLPGDPKRYGEIFKRVQERSGGPIPQTPQAIEREIEMRRKMLNERKVG